jgi:hypothetical protein
MGQQHVEGQSAVQFLHPQKIFQGEIAVFGAEWKDENHLTGSVVINSALRISSFATCVQESFLP